MANAAMLAAMTVPSAVRLEMMKEAPYQLSMSVSRSVRVNASNVGLSMSQVVLVVSAFGLSAVSTAQANGISHTSANAISTPAQMRLNSFSRRWIRSMVIPTGAFGAAIVVLAMVKPPSPAGVPA
jgi:hypothetical protein